MDYVSSITRNVGDTSRTHLACFCHRQHFTRIRNKSTVSNSGREREGRM